MTRAGSRDSAIRRSIWAGPLLAGVCFGLAYGVSQRLLALNVGELIRFGQGFDVQVFPGTSLESLRLRFGAADAELRGNLELQQLERQQEEAQTSAGQNEAPGAAAAPSEAVADPNGDGPDGGSEAANQTPAAEAPGRAALPAAPATPPPLPAAPAPVRP